MKTKIIRKIYIYKRTVKKGFWGPLLRTFNANNVIYIFHVFKMLNNHFEKQSCLVKCIDFNTLPDRARTGIYFNGFGF